jgi:hypothetical protein
VSGIRQPHGIRAPTRQVLQRTGWAGRQDANARDKIAKRILPSPVAGRRFLENVGLDQRQPFDSSKFGGDCQ